MVECGWRGSGEVFGEGLCVAGGRCFGMIICALTFVSNKTKLNICVIWRLTMGGGVVGSTELK